MKLVCKISPIRLYPPRDENIINVFPNREKHTSVPLRPSGKYAGKFFGKCGKKQTRAEKEEKPTEKHTHTTLTSLNYE